MSAIDDLSKARAEMPVESPTVDSWADKAWRNNCIVAEFDLEADGRFFALASQKVPMLKAERDAERLAWARLLKADGVRAALASGDYSEAAAAEYDAALRGLQDLGVDVDDLLGEQR